MSDRGAVADGRDASGAADRERRVARERQIAGETQLAKERRVARETQVASEGQVAKERRVAKERQIAGKRIQGPAGEGLQGPPRIGGYKRKAGAAWGDDGAAGDLSARVVRAAQAEIGVRETGENTGKRVDEYNACTKVRKAPWCASFVSFCFWKAGIAEPRTAWSPALFPASRCVRIGARQSAPRRMTDVRNEAAGLVLGIYYPSKGRIAHCGIMTAIKGDWCYSVEGNTNADGGREGDGVYAKKRHRRTIAKYANWCQSK